MSDTWYVLHDDYTGHNGRTYRVAPDGLECWAANRTWIKSAFADIQQLKDYALRTTARIYVTKPRKRQEGS